MRHFIPNKNCLMMLRAAVIVADIILLTAVKLFIHVRLVYIIATAAISLLGLLIAFIYLPLYFSSVEYIATNSEIIKKSGVFFKMQQSVQFSSVQYSTLICTPFSRYTGINILIFYVYGGRLRLMFLNKHDACEILSFSGCINIREE